MVPSRSSGRAGEETRCRLKSGAAGALAALLCALPLTVWLWGFSVDDALIVTRVAQNGLETGVFSFNRGGAPTDAITPFGFERLVGALARIAGGSGVAFESARWLGGIMHLSCIAALGFRLARERANAAPWLVLLGGVGGSVPLAAWAGAGLETPLVGALVLFGLWGLESAPASGSNPGSSSLELVGAALLGIAAAWRHELTPLGLTALFLIEPEGRAGGMPSSPPASAAGERVTSLPARAALGWMNPERLQRFVRRAGVFALPVVVIFGARWWCFDSLLPLSFIAKAPDFSSGLRYVFGGLVFGGVPALVLAASGAPRGRRALLLLGVHLVASLFAGGDWMPFYRLFVPLFPWLIWSAAREAPASWRLGVGLGWHLLGAALLLGGLGADARAVTERRAAWITAGREALQGARVVAAVDVGWLGQATSSRILDLAGVTDPRVARLPGGHTSKQISAGFFAREGVDAWVVRAFDRSVRPGDELEQLLPVYAVDHRLLREAADWGFVVTAVLPIEGTEGQYVFLRLPP